MKSKESIYKNSEGYLDLTAGVAIRRTEETKRQQVPMELTEAIRIMKGVAELAGYEVLGRICLRDKASGEVYH